MEKNCKIELLRFLAALMIMDGHIGVLFGEDPLRPFSGTWFYVEFFFMLTAFFTVRHFDKEKYCNLEPERKAVEGIKYTMQKFAKFMPYTIVPIFLIYLKTNIHILQEQGWMAFLCSLEDMPFEMIYMSAGNIHGTRLFPLWFISSMFIVFPAFCFLCQMKCRRFICMVSAYCVFFYYFSKYDYGSHVYPNQLVRTMCGLLMGYIIYEISSYFAEKDICRKGRWIITVIECISAFLPIICSIWNIRLLRIYFACFVLFLITTFSGHSLLPNMKNKLWIYLGQLSMPMYIWHYLIGTILNSFLNVRLGIKIGLFYGTTLAVSVINMFLVDRLRLETKQ